MTVILDTRGYEAPVETLEEKVAGMLRDLGGEIEAVENLGRQDFVRITEKNHLGDTYLRLKISGPASLPAAFQERIRLDKQIKRALMEHA